MPTLRSFNSRLVAICLVALVLRVAFIAYVPRQPDHLDDSLWYHRTGVAISQGHGYRSPFTGALTAQWPPGYPFLLGGVYKAFGDSPAAAKGLNVVLGTASVGLLGLAARKHFADRSALIAAAMLAAYPAHIYFTPLIMTETLFTFLLVSSYFLVGRLRPSLRSAAALGVLAGLASLVRGEGLLFPIAYGAYWLAQCGSPRRSLLLAATSAIVMAACIAPWTYRNYHVMGAFVTIGTASNEALWLGHHEGASGAWAFGRDTLAPQPRAGVSATEIEVEITSRERDDALRFMRDHPVEELRLIPRKLLFLFLSDGVPVGSWFSVPRGDGVVLSSFQVTALTFAADFYYYAILCGAMVGAGLMWRRKRELGPPLAFFASVIGTWLVMHGWLFFGDPRYHLPLMPLLMVFAAAAVDEIWRALVRVRDLARDDAAVMP